MCMYVHVHLPKILCTFDPIVHLGLDLSGGLEICGEPSILGFKVEIPHRQSCLVEL